MTADSPDPRGHYRALRAVEPAPVRATYARTELLQAWAELERAGAVVRSFEAGATWYAITDHGCALLAAMPVPVDPALVRAWLAEVHAIEQRRADELGHHEASGDPDDIWPTLDCPATRDEPLGDLPWGPDACDCNLEGRRTAIRARVDAERLVLARVDDLGDADLSATVVRILASGWRTRRDYPEEWAPALPVDQTPPGHTPASWAAYRAALTDDPPRAVLGEWPPAPGPVLARDAALLGMGVRLDIWRAGVSPTLSYRLRVDPSCVVVESHREHPVRAAIKHRDSPDGTRCGCGPGGGLA